MFTTVRFITKRSNSGRQLSPEDMLIGFAIAAPALAVGLWWFAWTVPPAVLNVHWIVSTLALVLMGFAINGFGCVLGGYLADSYKAFASSAYASLSLLRSIASAVFPFFTRQLYAPRCKLCIDYSSRCCNVGLREPNLPNQIWEAVTPCKQVCTI